jgi:hypothetical protein
VTLFRAPPAKGVRRPPPPEGIAFESLADSEVFQSLDDIEQKERNGLNLTPYEKFPRGRLLLHNQSTFVYHLRSTQVSSIT